MEKHYVGGIDFHRRRSVIYTMDVRPVTRLQTHRQRADGPGRSRDRVRR